MCVFEETDGERWSERERVRQTDKVRERCRGRCFVEVKKLIVFIGTDGQI